MLYTASIMRSAGQKKWQRGWTLVEILIVLLVVLIALSVAIPSINHWIQEYRLGLACQLVADNLQLAKMRAVSKTRRFELLFDVEGNRLGLEGGTLVSLPLGVTYGRGDVNATPDAAIDPELPVTFPPAEDNGVLRTAKFTGRGLPDTRPGAMHAVFVTNAAGTRCITMTSAGNVKIWVWDGAQWK